MNLVDTHAHIQFNGYKDDSDHVMKRALDADVVVINVGTQKDTSKFAVDMLEKYPENVYAAVGLHPEHTWRHLHDEDGVELALPVNEIRPWVGLRGQGQIQEGFFSREETFDYEYYKGLAQNPRVVGIGECGLDYYWYAKALEKGEITSDEIDEFKERQRLAFEAQLKLALELDKVLCIHCRPTPGTSDAYQDLIHIISPHASTLRFEVHCYTGDWFTAQQFLGLGGYLGINGILTFDKTGTIAEVVKNTPLERLILETDAPYLAPAPYRGKRNEPAFIAEVAKKIAEIRGVSVEEVEKQTTENAKKLFKLL